MWMLEPPGLNGEDWDEPLLSSYTYRRIQAYTYTHTHAHAYARTYTHTYTDTDTYARMHARTQTHTHTYRAVGEYSWRELWFYYHCFFFINLLIKFRCMDETGFAEGDVSDCAKEWTGNRTKKTKTKKNVKVRKGRIDHLFAPVNNGKIADEMKKDFRSCLTFLYFLY